MDDFNDYTKSGIGKCKSPSIQAREIIVTEMRRQGLTESNSAILLPMTFRLLGQKQQGAIQLESEYWIEYQGR